MMSPNSPRRGGFNKSSEPAGSPRRSKQVATLTLLGLLFTLPIVSAARAANDAARLEAQRLVAAAAQAEIAGDATRSLSLLHEAIGSDPDNQLARWQLGQVQLENKWESVEEAQHRAAADPLQAEYCQRRTAAGPNLEDQLGLARWCRTSKLDVEAQFHWASVLSMDQKNEEALRSLDMRWKDGQLISRNETSQHKHQSQETKNAAKRWEPTIAKWRRAVAGRDVPAHDAALAEIRAIDKLDAIPSIEAVTLGRDAFDMKHAEECLQIAVAFIDALEKMPDQVATESLVRHAVFSPGNKARTLAIEKLKPREQHNYVPLLLSGLSMPIESTYSVTTDANGNVRYTQSLYREGPDADLSVDANSFTMQHILPGSELTNTPGTIDFVETPESIVARAQRVAMSARDSEARYKRAAGTLEAQVQRANYTSAQTSTRIIPVLSYTTGNDFGTAKQWWNWWRDKNEYYTSEHPVDYRYFSNTDDQYYGITPIQRHSCFAKGTAVWTKTGRKTIETVERGDLVLSQNVNTGELTYKPVVVRTKRPTGRIVKISLDHEELLSTTGHPFWVAGLGWRMAKELGEGAILHCVKGITRVQAIEPSADTDAYNLEVAEFNTYFVGEVGMLVHDITPRQPAQVILPGIAAK